jgi:hypothetical protein
MSMQITEAFVQQYRNNVFHLSQQKGSRLRGAVRSESMKGKHQFFERIGATSAVQRTTRHGDTPQMDTPHSRRRVSLADFEVADLIDDQDKIRTLIDPTNPYVQSFMFALGRSMDDVIISGGLGTAYSGETGSTPVVLPNSQKLLAATEAAPTTPTNLNVDTLRKIKRLFDANDVDESLPRYIALTSSQLYALLGQTQITSADYAAVKALVQGQLDSFMGFKFIRTERLPTANYLYDGDGEIAGSGTALNGARSVMAWAQDGIVMAVGNDMEARISERDDKSYATQVYARMSIGATRLEEAKVVEIACKEA